MGLVDGLRAVLVRNKLLIAVIAVTFFSLLIVSAVVAYAILLASPELVTTLKSFIGSTRSYVAIPPPYTKDLYVFIFTNNIGHFWNPARIWVWIPLIGAYSLGYELVFNAVLIGAVASFTSLTKGAIYTILGLTPHGVIELPAFILEFAGLARWHITSTRAIYTRLSGRPVDRPLLFEGLKDTVVLSVLSVVLFAVAALIESYVTPRLLGM